MNTTSTWHKTLGRVEQATSFLLQYRFSSDLGKQRQGCGLHPLRSLAAYTAGVSIYVIRSAGESATAYDRRRGGRTRRKQLAAAIREGIGDAKFHNENHRRLA